jgi:hypothetical protein
MRDSHPGHPKEIIAEISQSYREGYLLQSRDRHSVITLAIVPVPGPAAPKPQRPSTPGIEPKPSSPKPQRPSIGGAWGGLGFVGRRGGSFEFLNHFTVP